VSSKWRPRRSSYAQGPQSKPPAPQSGLARNRRPGSAVMRCARRLNNVSLQAQCVLNPAAFMNIRIP
jgi:hypothetical protein